MQLFMHSLQQINSVSLSSLSYKLFPCHSFTRAPNFSLQCCSTFEINLISKCQALMFSVSCKSSKLYESFSTETKQIESWKPKLTFRFNFSSSATQHARVVCLNFIANMRTITWFIETCSSSEQKASKSIQSFEILMQSWYCKHSMWVVFADAWINLLSGSMQILYEASLTRIESAIDSSEIFAHS